MNKPLVLEVKDDCFTLTEEGYGLDDAGEKSRLTLLHIAVIPVGKAHYGIYREEPAKEYVHFGSMREAIKKNILRVYDEKEIALQVAYQYAREEGKYYAKERNAALEDRCPQI